MVEWREFHHLKLAKLGLVSNQIGSNSTCQHFFLQSSRQVPGRWPAWPAPPGRLRSWRWTCPPAWCGGAFEIPHSIDHNNVPSPGPGITHGKAQHCILARERNQAENDTIETTWNDTSNSFSTKVVYKCKKPQVFQPLILLRVLHFRIWGHTVSYLWLQWGIWKTVDCKQATKHQVCCVLLFAPRHCRMDFLNWCFKWMVTHCFQWRCIGVALSADHEITLRLCLSGKSLGIYSNMSRVMGG